MRLVRFEWPGGKGLPMAWERLRAAAPTEAVFLTPEWLDLWWRHLGPGGGGRPLALGVLDGERMVGLAPLYWAPIGGTGLRALRLMGGGVSDYLDLLLTPDEDERRSALGVLLDGLARRQGGWDALDLRGVPAESPTAGELLAAAEARGLPCATLPGYARPGIALGGTFDAFLRSKPGKFRYNLRSRLRRLGELGEVRFRTVRAPADVPAALDRLVQLHGERWADQHTGTMFSSSERGRRFYRDACRAYAERGLLDLTLLDVGDRTVAGSVSFVDRDTWYYYLPAWDPALAAYAPSTLLLAHLIESAYARGLRRFDFMLGEEPYKARWATEERRTVNLVVGGRGVRGRAAFLALVAWQRARDRARRSARLQQLRRHGLGSLRSAIRVAGCSVDGRDT